MKRWIRWCRFTVEQAAWGLRPVVSIGAPWAASLGLALSLVLPVVCAGEHTQIADPSGGPPEPAFVSTEAERRRDGVTLVLRDHRPEDGTVLIAAWPSFGFTVCDRQPLRLHRGDGDVLEVPLITDHLACIGRIPVAAIRQPLILQIPMFNAPPRWVILDTATLDVQRLTSSAR